MKVKWRSILELVRTHFAACSGEEAPRAKIREGGGAAPMTISSLSLTPSFALAQDLENLLFTESVPLHRILLSRRRGVTFWIDQFTTLYTEALTSRMVLALTHLKYWR